MSRAAFLFAALLPFASLVWGGVVFIFQATINVMVLQRDPGIGDTFVIPLPNGFSLLIIDAFDDAFVYTPKTQPDGAIIPQDDAAGGVTRLQIAGSTLLGTTGDGQYFVVDTQKDHVRYAGAPELDAVARKLGVALHMIPVEDLYFANRFTWFDFTALVLLFAAPAVAGVWGLAWILRLRRQAR